MELISGIMTMGFFGMSLLLSGVFLEVMLYSNRKEREERQNGR